MALWSWAGNGSADASEVGGSYATVRHHMLLYTLVHGVLVSGSTCEATQSRREKETAGPRPT